MPSIAVVGSRDFPDMEMVRVFVRSLPRYVTLVSGGARGVDSVAEEEAVRCGIAVETFRPDWSGLGRVAGFIRNRSIVEAADRVVAFWDGQSKGTQYTIRLARAKGVPVEVVPPRGG